MILGSEAQHIVFLDRAPVERLRASPEGSILRTFGERSWLSVSEPEALQHELCIMIDRAIDRGADARAIRRGGGPHRLPDR